MYNKPSEISLQILSLHEVFDVSSIVTFLELVEVGDRLGIMLDSETP
jgi:hypothetical protein